MAQLQAAGVVPSLSIIEHAGVACQTKVRGHHWEPPRKTRGSTAGTWSTAASAGLAAAGGGVAHCKRCRQMRRRSVSSVAVPTEPTATASAKWRDEDVVVVYDPSCQQCLQVLEAVDRDCSMAPKPVAYSKVSSTDSSSIAALALRRNLEEESGMRLQQTKTVTAVLPNGAVLEGLEENPGPLLRELRYRTCLEWPSAAEQEKLEQKYFGPLRSMRDSRRWWHDAEVLSTLSEQLDREGFVLVDDFLPPQDVQLIRDANEELYRSEDMQPGLTTGGSDRVGLPHRGDMLRWVGYGGTTPAEQGTHLLADSIETLVGGMRDCSEAGSLVGKELSTLQFRSEMMLTCYPGSSRARYFRHSDNSSGNGRLVTAILYLNKGWQQGDGGELRLFNPGAQNMKVKHEVQPIWNRLLLFWSTDRCPHEVLSACKDRYAATVWYYNLPNPAYSLYEVSDNFHKGVALQAPASSKAAAEPVKTNAAPAPADCIPEGALIRPLLLYDGSDEQAMDIAKSIKGDTLNLNVEAAAAKVLEQARSSRWVELLRDKGVAGICAEAGKAFLVLPDGSLVADAVENRAIVDYELEYARRVDDSDEAILHRVERSVLEPLQKLSKEGEPGVWWTMPEAVQIWAQALSQESFFALDNFLPKEAAEALAKASESVRDSMEPGCQATVGLSAAARGDNVKWVRPQDMEELDGLIQNLNTLVSGMMALPMPAVQARLKEVSGLSDAMFSIYPGDKSENARYVRHVDNEDGKNGRQLACVYYLNKDWDTKEDGGELRLFEGDQQRVKADIAPVFNRLVAYFTDASIPHEVRRALRERRAVTIWYINLEQHLAYHEGPGK
mmetsp:Transcript_42892/g.100657  ORF Transcript_42892/g.100657 Transcript_42892/m.100657 type:complete len:837 (-) Transcript_42892:98-2608(-)